MDSACVYDQKIVIQELTQGIEMAKHLRVNLDSAEAREFFINKILSSYQNALFVLKSAESFQQPQATALPAPSLPESVISVGSPESTESEFEQFDQSFFDHLGQDVISKKRKGSTTWDNQESMYTDNVFEIPYNGKHIRNHDAKSAVLPPLPPLQKKREIRPAHHHQHHEVSPTPNEMLSNLRANLSVHASDFGAIIPSSMSFLSAPFGFMEDYQQILLPNNFHDELLPVYSPPFISPDTSGSNYFSEWESSSSQEFVADPIDVNNDFIYNNYLF